MLYVYAEENQVTKLLAIGWSKGGELLKGNLSWARFGGTYKLRSVEQFAAVVAPARPVPGAEDGVRLGGAAQLQLVGIEAGQSPARTRTSSVGRNR